MKALSVLFASAIAGVVMLVLVGLTILLPGYSLFSGRVGAILPTLVFILILSAGGFLGAWICDRLEMRRVGRSVTVGQGALVGGLGGLFSVVVVIVLFIAMIVRVFAPVYEGIPFWQAFEQTMPGFQFAAQELGYVVAVLILLITLGIPVGIFVFLGAVGGGIGAAILGRRVPADSAASEREAVA